MPLDSAQFIDPPSSKNPLGLGGVKQGTNITIAGDGTISAQSSGTITEVKAGTGLNGGGTSGSVTLNLTDTGVSARSYSSANITVDAQGRITSASDGGSGGDIPSGSRFILCQNGAPSGWSTVSVADNSALRMVNSGGGSTGGGVAFTDYFKSGKTTLADIAFGQRASASTQGWALASDQGPTHRHQYGLGSTAQNTNPNTTIAATNASGPLPNPNNLYTEYYAGGATHSHSMAGTYKVTTLTDDDLKYVNVICCSKN